MADPSLEAQIALSDLRLAVLNRQKITPDQYRLVLRALRGDRERAARASAADKRRAKRIMDGTATTAKPAISLTEMFPQLQRTDKLRS